MMRPQPQQAPGVKVAVSGAAGEATPSRSAGTASPGSLDSLWLL